MHRVLIDNGSSADILYYLAFQQMRIDKKQLVPINAPLVGFGGTRVFPLGAVTLSVTVGDYPQQITKDVTFLVVDLVDSTAGYELLSFMDAFSSYNQIKMDETDQEKTSSVTSRGLFYYKVMPFKLKNAGATYQRLMDKMFVHQIGRNVQVYVDGMLVKSVRENNH